MDPTLIVFIGLAAFVAYKLFSVLGTRTGHEQRHDLEAVQTSRGAETRHEAAPAPKPIKALGPVSAAAEPLRVADPDFDEKAFLEGARGAYEMVVEAFAGGDLKSIRRYLGQSVYDAFKAAPASLLTTFAESMPTNFSS
ncbi:MAG: Tim44/TimA family putative adaptor protein [Amphiplicatus sp.]